MRRLYRRLGITVLPGQEWKYVLPWITFSSTALVVIFAGMATGVSAAVYAPMAFFFGLCFAGIPVSYMATGHDAHGDDG
jgi:hypothetical protein